MTGLSGTTRPLEATLKQEGSTLRFPVASKSPASTWTSVLSPELSVRVPWQADASILRLPGASTSPASTWTAAQAATDKAASDKAPAATGKIAADKVAIAEMPDVKSHSSCIWRLFPWRRA